MAAVTQNLLSSILPSISPPENAARIVKCFIQIAMPVPPIPASLKEAVIKKPPKYNVLTLPCDADLEISPMHIEFLRLELSKAILEDPTFKQYEISPIQVLNQAKKVLQNAQDQIV